jgi:biopolymer transport protein ExbB
MNRKAVILPREEAIGQGFQQNFKDNLKSCRPPFAQKGGFQYEGKMDWLKFVIDYGIIGFLILLSMMAIGIAIERFHVFKHIKLEDFPDQKSLELELTNKMHLIATIGSNAPYIGLLGTVLGIMLTFYMIGQEGFMDTGKIMVGLALALKATAIGLLVAIPSVSLYNFLLRKVKVLLMTWEIERGRKGV